MNLENTKNLLEKYPEIFKLVTSPDPISLFMFECGDGWYDLIDVLCRSIEFHLKHNAEKDTPPFICDQVKEKFGTLRFYGHGGDKTVWNYITFAENFSGRICETCGNPGTLIQDTGWWYTACKDHYKKE